MMLRRPTLVAVQFGTLAEPFPAPICNAALHDQQGLLLLSALDDNDDDGDGELLQQNLRGVIADGQPIKGQAASKQRHEQLTSNRKTRPRPPMLKLKNVSQLPEVITREQVRPIILAAKAQRMPVFFWTADSESRSRIKPFPDKGI